MNINNEILYIDLQYFANVNWYKKAVQYKYIEFDKSEYHVKMSFRNRLWLSGADGLLSLSIPLVNSRNEQQLYKDVRIAPGKWQVIHFRTITSCYNRSPWFEHYCDELAVLYNQQHTFLMDWNLACFEWINRQFANRINWRFASPGGNYPAGTTRRVIPAGWENGNDFTNLFRPGNKEEWLGTEVIHMKYTQVFEDRVGFIPGLSVLDLLFCEGPAALNVLS
ncbi:WbqC family protein [Flavihumibacter profundi]|uniref:WbqC family protein n=1 Tax=Flavihumibacter profundi TaxID=2716883 RepID=UPI001CC4E17D|nr:WbqC family protein [Flavihumibacter profundi]MBZ5855808.1 WbqC family protein [Flavihumibacter profundi]